MTRMWPTLERGVMAAALTKRRTTARGKLLAGLMLLPALGVLAADSPRPKDFLWRATMNAPTGASIARIELPADALARLQSNDAHDIRVFNANEEPVGFTITGMALPAASPTPIHTRSYDALPLFSSASRKPPGGSSVQVHVSEGDGQGSVWVQLSAAGSASGADAGTRLPSAIFSTRPEKQTWGAVTVQATLPSNTPVQLTAAASADLAQWTPLALRGTLYRFEGPDAPLNDTLEFEQPVSLENRYLRLSWHDHEGVLINAISGVVAQPHQSTPQVRAVLPVPRQIDKSSLEWSLDFATPLSGLVLATSRPNSLLPVRILGRNDTAQPWRQLGRTVVYRLGSDAAQITNPPVSFGGPSMRQLRVEASNGLALDAANFQASAEFAPLQIAFLVSGPGPFVLAAGRAQTVAMALSASDLVSVLPGKMDDLPSARITSVTQTAAGHNASWLGKLTDGVTNRTLGLWGILTAGVVLLAGVAFRLLRQLKPEKA